MYEKKAACSIMSFVNVSCLQFEGARVLQEGLLVSILMYVVREWHGERRENLKIWLFQVNKLRDSWGIKKIHLLNLLGSYVR